MKPLTGESIKKLLKTRMLGNPIYVFDEVGSTNDVAFDLGRNGATEGTVVIADSQTNGRGRLERRWISPPGVNLYMSVIFRPRIAAKNAALLTLISSISLVEAIKAAEGVRKLPIHIKWPNDIVINEKKAAGILTEMEPRGDGVDFIILGIGVNLNMTKETMERDMGDAANRATSLMEEAGCEIERAEFASNLIGNLEVWYRKFLNYGKSPILRGWTERWGAVNRRVRISLGNRTVEGIASGIDENGYLILRKYDGTDEKIISGDIVLL